MNATEDKADLMEQSLPHHRKISPDQPQTTSSQDLDLVKGPVSRRLGREKWVLGCSGRGSKEENCV